MGVHRGEPGEGNPRVGHLGAGTLKTLTINGTTYACPFAASYDPHSPAELRTLDESIARRGVRDKVGTYDSPVHGPSIYDGVTRATLALKHDKPVPVEHEGELTDEQAEQLLDEAHLGRRNLTPKKQEERRKARVERVAEKRSEGKSIRTIAEEEGVSKSQVERDLSTVPGGTVEPKKVKGKDGKTRPATKKKPTVPGGTVERNGKPDKDRAPQFFWEKPPHPVTGDTWPAAAALTKGTKFFPRVILLPSGAEGIYDAYGQIVPPGVGDYFNDPGIRDLREDWCDIKNRVDEFRTKLNRLKSGKKYPWTDESKVIAAVEKMDHASDTILILLGDSHPYLVCPDCRGEPNKRCASCRCTGYWPLSKCDANPARMPTMQKVGVKP